MSETIDTSREAVGRLLMSTATNGERALVQSLTDLVRALLDERDEKDKEFRREMDAAVAAGQFMIEAQRRIIEIVTERAEAAEKLLEEAAGYIKNYRMLYPNSVVSDNAFKWLTRYAERATVGTEKEKPCTCKGLGRFAFQLDPNCPKHSVEASAGVATDHVWHGGICKMCGEDARRVIRGEPCSNPPATGRYDEIVKELEAASSRESFSYNAALLDRAASALREAQQRIAELEAR